MSTDREETYIMLIQITVPIVNVSFLSAYSAFKTFASSLVFRSLILMCLGKDFLVYLA